MINYYLEQRNVKSPQQLSMFCEGLNTSPRNKPNLLHQLHPFGRQCLEGYFSYDKFYFRVAKNHQKSGNDS